MKKNGLSLFALFVLSISLASAGPVDGLRLLLDGSQDMFYILFNFISDILFNLDTFDEFAVAKTILFMVILMIVYTVIKKSPFFGENNAIKWIISISVSVLSVRYLTENFIQIILLQYGALGVGLTTMVPLFIYLLFIHQAGIGPFGRKGALIIYFISLLTLTVMRDIDQGAAVWLYLSGLGIIIVAYVLDKKIHDVLVLHEIHSRSANSRTQRRVYAQKQLDAVEDNNTKGYYKNAKEYQRAKNHWIRIIKDNS